MRYVTKVIPLISQNQTVVSSVVLDNAFLSPLQVSTRREIYKASQDQISHCHHSLRQISHHLDLS